MKHDWIDEQIKIQNQHRTRWTDENQHDHDDNMPSVVLRVVLASLLFIVAVLPWVIL